MYAYTRCVPKDMKYIFLPLSYWSQPVLTGWLSGGDPYLHSAPTVSLLRESEGSG